ncbi:helix-turn-helix domain-containing protein [Cohnella faecalis]|uniref:Helix-turn-helix domain-containing protein n=1 Tax=Cohnella faecalis TaxID=2315694 RepID=A0A398CP50_9BACL|nr:helix-turn-helix domain-containing protein [Cohnella faecalis]
MDSAALRSNRQPVQRLPAPASIPGAIERDCAGVRSRRRAEVGSIRHRACHRSYESQLPKQARHGNGRRHRESDVKLIFPPFQKTTGESPIEYLTKLRMDSAKSLLSQKKCTIKTVSSAVGYEDEFHFSRMFHRHVGVPPTFYRKVKKLRVAVAASLPYRDSLLSFGVEPVASVNLFRYPGMAVKEYELVFASQWEELERAKPDLIIGDFYHFSFRDRFQGIAPVSSLLADRSWVNNYRKMAEILGSSEEAEQAVNRLAMRVAAARSLLAARMGGKSIVVLQVTNHNIRIQGATDHPLSELLFGELGLQPGRTEQSNAKRLELQPEWLPQIDTDYALVFQNHIRAGSETIYDRMCGTHAWRSMRAVQNGNVLLIPNWFKMSWSPIGREEIIDELLMMTDTLPEAAKESQ